MNDKQIDAMLSDIIQHADYDLWKGFFSRHPEDPEMAESTREELREVARRHIDKAAEGKKRLSGSEAATLLAGRPTNGKR
jgi:hypothetical protein